MSLKRVLRALVCFLLICCILINCSPIRAKAVVTEALVVTGAGVFAIMFSIAMGLVAVDLTAQLINNIGDHMTQHLYQWGSSAEKLDEVESFLTLLPPQFDNDSDDDGGDDGSEDPSANTFVIPTDILDGLIDWAKGLINGDEIEVEGEAAPEGYAYYNGYLFPTLRSMDGYPYEFIFYHSTESCYYSVVSEGLVGSYGSGSSNYGPGSSSYVYVLESETWKYSANYPGKYSRYSFNLHPIVWSNHDVCNVYDSEEVYFIGSEPVYVGTETVTIPNYVGDIPQQVKDGTFDEEAFVLPYINYALPFQGQLDAVSALNNLSTQLMDQTLTYDQYMEQIQAEPSTTPDPDPGIDPGGGSEVNSDLSNYAVDLTSFFPFCIPFDIYKFLTLLMAEPEAPRFEFKFNLGEYLGTHYLVIDLSQWNDTALLLRRLELLLFIIGLAMATRNYYIRG